MHTAGTLYNNIYARWLPALASERDGRHTLITYNDFGGLFLALFIMATNKLNENYETERRTFVGNLFWGMKSATMIIARVTGAMQAGE